MAVVRDAGHVSKGGVSDGCSARDERRPHAKIDSTAKAKETLIEGPGYGASRAGRSAGRSLSWHGRGRGFKSHPVHTYNGSKLLSPETSLRSSCHEKAKASGEHSLRIRTSRGGTTTSHVGLGRPRTTTTGSSVGSSKQTT